MKATETRRANESFDIIDCRVYVLILFYFIFPPQFMVHEPVTETRFSAKEKKKKIHFISGSIYALYQAFQIFTLLLLDSYCNVFENIYPIKLLQTAARIFPPSQVCICPPGSNVKHNNSFSTVEK